MTPADALAPVEQMLTELRDEGAALELKANDAQSSIDSGFFNAFLELSFRRTRDDAIARAVMVRFKVQALEELVERMKKRWQT